MESKYEAVTLRISSEKLNPVPLDTKFTLPSLQGQSVAAKR